MRTYAETLLTLPRLGVFDAAGWMHDAACRECDVNMFFPASVSEDPDAMHKSVYAKSICRQCKVRVECGDYARTNNIAFGIWGGMSVKERRRR